MRISAFLIPNTVRRTRGAPRPFEALRRTNPGKIRILCVAGIRQGSGFCRYACGKTQLRQNAPRRYAATTERSLTIHILDGIQPGRYARTGQRPSAFFHIIITDQPLCVKRKLSRPSVLQPVARCGIGILSAFPQNGAVQVRHHYFAPAVQLQVLRSNRRPWPRANHGMRQPQRMDEAAGRLSCDAFDTGAALSELITAPKASEIISPET